MAKQMKIHKSTLVLLIFTTLSSFSVAQQVDLANVSKIGKSKPVAFSGGLSAGSVMYGGNPQPGRQEWTYYLNGSLNVNIFGQINIPVNVNLTNLGANIAYPSLPNRLSLHPTYKWVTAHMGDASMTFSPYTLNGHQFTGAGVELAPGKWKISAMGGRLLRKVVYSGVNPSVMPNYERFGYGLKTEYTAAKYDLGVSIFTGKDKEDEIARLVNDSLGIQPMQNMALSLSAKLNTVKNMSFIVEYGISFLNRNLYNSGSENRNTYHAVNARLNYQFMKNTVGIGYERIDPDYKTLGAYYFNNDYENITLNYSRPFLKGDKANIALSFGVQRDDLDHKKEEATNRYVASAGLNYTPSEKIQTSFNYSTFQSYRNLKSQFDYINETSPYQNLDTLNYSQLSQNMEASVLYNFRQSDKQSQRLNLTASYQESADRQGGIATPGNVSRFANSGLGYSISFIPQSISVNASFNLSYSYASSMESYTYGPMLGITANLLKKTLTTGFSTSYNVNMNGAVTQAKVLNLRTNAGYALKKKHNLRANFVWQNKDISGKAKKDITTTTISYSYSF
ncbi:MAG: hypothetical protein H6Q14_509 [Bacteroidetes bacterium]|nr:hypothetical protein [Bacteroidota bacterium]